MSETGRRRKVVLISEQLLNDLFAVGYHGHIRCTEGVPADAHYLVFESAEWEPVAFGWVLPQQEMRFTRYYTTDLLDRAAALLENCPAWMEEYQAIRGMIE